MKFLSRDLLYFAFLVVLVKVAINQHSTSPDDMLPLDTSALALVEPAPAGFDQAATLPAAIEAQAPAEQPAVVASSAFPPVRSNLGEDGSPQSNFNAVDTTASTEPTHAVPLTTTLSEAELQESTLKQIDVTQQQVEAALPLIKETTQHAALVKSLRQKLLQLRKMYQQSQTTPVFGPNKNTPQPDVVSEHSVEKDLLRVVNKLGIILNEVVKNAEDFKAADSVTEGLIHNNQLIEKAIAS